MNKSQNRKQFWRKCRKSENRKFRESFTLQAARKQRGSARGRCDTEEEGALLLWCGTQQEASCSGVTQSKRPLLRVELKTTEEESLDFFLDGEKIVLGVKRAFPGPQNKFINLRPSPCLLYTSPSPRDLSTSRMPSSA